MKVSFNGYNEKELTFISEEEITLGYPVTISANSTVCQCDEDDVFVGFCTYSDSENTSVQMSGHVKTKFSDTAPTLGSTKLAAGTDGAVKEAASGGRDCIVLSVNETDSTVEFLF